MHIQKRSKLNLLFSALFCAVAILTSGMVARADFEPDPDLPVYVTPVMSFYDPSINYYTHEVEGTAWSKEVGPYVVHDIEGHFNIFTLSEDKYERSIERTYNGSTVITDGYSHMAALLILSDCPFKVDGNAASYNSTYSVYYYNHWLNRGMTYDNNESTLTAPNVLYVSDWSTNFNTTAKRIAYLVDKVDFSRDITGEENSSDRWDYDHNFGADVYDSSIPVPQLSSLNILGAFHVDNADPSRDLDLYVETNFYGVLHDDDNKDFKLNKDYLVGHHRYNFTSPDVSYSDADWSISEKYGVEIGDAMMEDFQRWTELFPTHKDLPDYNWLKHNSADYTSAYTGHIYSDSAPAYALRRSKQCEVTYYVRFCQYSGGTYKYGQWKAYTISPDGQTTSRVSIGDVSSDSNGNPVVTNPVSGNQNGDGEFEIELPTNVNLDTSNIFQTVIDIIKQFPELVSAYIAFSQFLVATFAFIPVQIWGAIATCFNLSVVILLYKYVRGM